MPTRGQQVRKIAGAKKRRGSSSSRQTNKSARRTRRAKGPYTSATRKHRTARLRKS